MSNYRVIQGSAHHIPQLADKSVQAIMCSPPYFGLRAYSGDQGIEWPTVEYAPMPGLPPIRVQGCEPGCVHEWGDQIVAHQRGTVGDKSTLVGNQNGGRQQGATQGAYCIHCGGWRGPLGLEPTIEAYIGHLILCLREWRRVLRDDGLVWCNLADSYAGSGGAHAPDHANPGLSKSASRNGHERPTRSALPAKNLYMVPARFALAAQADGWFLRSAIVWAKGVSFLPDYAGSCMPESVTDRPTQSYEMVYMLAKSERYFYDAEAVKEPLRLPGAADGSRIFGGANKNGAHIEHARTTGRPYEQSPTGRQLRSVWIVNPQPLAMAHFAAWPQKLVEPMVLASTSEYGCCPACGAAYRRVVEREGITTTEKRKMLGDSEKRGAGGQLVVQNLDYAGAYGNNTRLTITTGWQPLCTCDAGPPIPCTVLDPFVGSGTTLLVANRLGRNAIGVDLSETYLTELVPERMDAVSLDPVQLAGSVDDWAEAPLFAGVEL